MSEIAGPNTLFWRAVTAVLALPAVVGYLAPWLLRPDGRQAGMSGLLLIVIGTVLLLWCVRDFYVAGRGTLAPWAPPAHLVTVGLYRISRNPMYVAVLTVVCGWAIGYRSMVLSIYAAGLAIAFHLRIVLHEEPFLNRTHGKAWLTYRASVRRWAGWRRGAAVQSV
jgi:protein-S-isoprenylcysteine O-methyltransferase Ste14